MEWREVQAEAKRLGINSHGKKRPQLEAEIAAKSNEIAANAVAQPGLQRDEAPRVGLIHAEERAYFPSSAGDKSELHVGDPVVAPRGDRPTERPEPMQRARVPLGTPRQKLNYPSREGYVRRWFNDQRNRIHDAQAAGYEFVEEEQDGRLVKLSRLVGTREDGSPMMAYLMEIRQEFYDEDQAEKQKPLDEFDAQLRRGLSNPDDIAAEDRSKLYTPDEGTSLRHGN